MALVKWDPFRDIAELQNRINRMFDESFGGSRDLDDEINSHPLRPAVDIYEGENGIVVAVELPGVSKQNVSVEVKDDVLTLKGERQANPAVKEDSYYLRERLFGPFRRSFTLHQNIQPELIKATFKEGILEIELPKPAQEHHRQIKVNVE
jgi:HSP20 family protein